MLIRRFLLVEERAWVLMELEPSLPFLRNNSSRPRIRPENVVSPKLSTGSRSFLEGTTPRSGVAPNTNSENCGQSYALPHSRCKSQPNYTFHQFSPPSSPCLLARPFFANSNRTLAFRSSNNVLFSLPLSLYPPALLRISLYLLRRRVLWFCHPTFCVDTGTPNDNCCVVFTDVELITSSPTRRAFRLGNDVVLTGNLEVEVLAYLKSQIGRLGPRCPQPMGRD